MEKKDPDTRRLSAIMFTDMVGYSAMTQINEQKALGLLEEHRKIIRSHFTQCHGREIETAGDAFFVEFGSALEAVQCAVLIQKDFFERNKKVSSENRILIRIGLHVGDVIYHDNQVLGDGVNIASRMEPLAEPGGICLSEDVFRQIYNKVDYRLINLGKSELKNIRLPMNIYKVELPWLEPELLRLKYQKTYLAKHLKLVLAIVLFGVIIFIGIRSENSVGWLSALKTDTAGKKQANRIAVLPFENFSADKNDEYLADGLTEEIITVLSKINKLDVIARTSVMKYKNSKKDINEIAGDLSVNIVLEGSVRIERNRIKVTAQLINALTQDHLWANTYDRNFDDIFSLQEDVAFQVAKSLEMTLADLDKDKIKKRKPENIDAYNYYLKGRFYWNKRSPENILLGLEYFNKAIQTDPAFALAYCGVADSYHLLASYGILKPEVAFTQARMAAMKSLKLDETLAESNNSLAAIHLLYDWDWQKAKMRFLETLRLDPDYVQANLWYSFFLSIQKEFTTALHYMNHALELDPLSAIARTDLGEIYYHARQYDKSIAEYRHSLLLDSTYVYAYAYLGQVLAVAGKIDEAEQIFSRAVTLTNNQDPATLAGLAYVFALKGNHNQVYTILTRLKNAQSEYYVHPMYIAMVYTALGDKKNALDWLEKGYNDRSEWMVCLQVEHMLDPLRDEPGFQKLLTKMGFAVK